MVNSDGNSKKIETFWNVFGEKTKSIKLNLDNYLKWLESEGFFKRENEDGSYVLVRIVDNVVSEVRDSIIRRHILTYFRSLPFKFDGVTRTSLINWYGNNHNKMTTKAVFDLIESREIDFYRDNMKSAKIFYQNCVVVVEPDEIKSISYSEFDGVIWERQLVKRDVRLVEYDNYGMFEQFLRNIFGEKSGNLRSVMTAIGYLIHNYKPTSYAPAIVLNDKVISDNPEGGTGKGIFAKAINQFKNGVVLDGKSFDFNKNFMFQRVEAFTDLLIFDDVKKTFDFERLFSIITEGIAVEKKNKGEFFIPFEHSPKILITTNYTLKGEGNSIERRKIDFELEQHYRKNYTPQDEFGKIFFYEWNENDWTQFDNFMLKCIQVYLKYGLVLPKNENLAEKRLIANTSDGFIEFMEDYQEYGVEIFKKTFAEVVRHNLNLFNLKPNTTTKWLKLYCDFYGIPIIEGRKDNARTIKIGESNDSVQRIRELRRRETHKQEVIDYD